MNEFDDFYRKNLRLVYSLALAQGLIPCLAEELTQETFLRAWRHNAVLAGMEAMAQRAWLVKTLRNLIHDNWRQSRPTTTIPLEMADDSVEHTERTALRLDVANALSALSESEREIVTLRYFLQLNSREIGEMLHLPESTVRRKLMECRKLLAEKLVGWESTGEKQ